MYMEESWKERERMQISHGSLFVEPLLAGATVMNVLKNLTQHIPLIPLILTCLLHLLVHLRSWIREHTSQRRGHTCKIQIRLKFIIFYFLQSNFYSLQRSFLYLRKRGQQQNVYLFGIKSMGRCLVHSVIRYSKHIFVERFHELFRKMYNHNKSWNALGTIMWLKCAAVSSWYKRKEGRKRKKEK